MAEGAQRALPFVFREVPVPHFGGEGIVYEAEGMVSKICRQRRRKSLSIGNDCFGKLQGWLLSNGLFRVGRVELLG